MPHIVTVANGPGRVAFSHNTPGELVVLPLHPGMELDVREHAFLLASHSIQYSFVRIKGLANVLHGGSGMFMDRFITAQYPGLLMLHGNGDVLERTLRPGREDLGRARRLPLQGLHRPDAGDAAAGQDRPHAPTSTWRR